MDAGEPGEPGRFDQFRALAPGMEASPSAQFAEVAAEPMSDFAAFAELEHHGDAASDVEDALAELDGLQTPDVDMEEAEPEPAHPLDEHEHIAVGAEPDPDPPCG